MAGTVRIQQPHKAILDRRIQIVIEKVFPVRQLQLLHYSLDRTRIVADCQYKFLTEGIFRDQLVGRLLRTCGVSLWGKLFWSGNNKIAVLQLVGFTEQKVAEKLFPIFKFRLNVTQLNTIFLSII